MLEFILSLSFSILGGERVLQGSLMLSCLLVAKQIPLSHISENVYKTSTDWIGQRSSDALVPFLEWSLDSVLADLESHQLAAKGSKKVAQQVPSKSQVSFS